MSTVPYRAPHWLPGAHLQTIWPLLLKRRLPHPPYQRERLNTPDGDFVDLDWVEPNTELSTNLSNTTQGTKLSTSTPSNAPQARGASAAGAGLPPLSASTAGAVNPSMATPLIVLFHGLEGSSHSHYATALMHAVAQNGWRGVVMHFRGCSGTPNMLPRAYHSGDSVEINWVLSELRQRYPHAPLFAVGVSLGGNALLKHLGEQGMQQRSSPHIDAAVAVSVPYDLSAAADTLSQGFALRYSQHFLSSLIPRTLAKAARFPNHPVLRAQTKIRAARNLREFDEAVTAPLHGFQSAAHYYQTSSSAQFLPFIRCPTLLLHAANDPFLPIAALPAPQTLPPNVQLHLSHHGGHVGFVSGALPGKIDWLPQRILSYFRQQISAQRVP